MPLKCLNRRLRMGVVATAGVVLLPSAAFAAPEEHRVQRGETLSEIAVRYGVTTGQLAGENGLSDPHHIEFGRVLRLPGAAGADGSSGGVTVAAGQTLSEIALRHGVSAQALAEANGLADANRIQAGAQLRLPGSGGAAAASSGASSDSVLHAVTAGQTLTGIAARYRVTPADIAAANDLADPDHLVVGDTLRIPVTGRPAAGTASRATVERIIEEKARQHGWDADLIKALAWQESGWNNAAVSSVGAIGIMQVLPSTNRDVSSPRAGRTLDLDDPADNVEAGIRFLDLLHDLTGGDTERILAGYYQGLRSVRENGMYPSTEQYIANILALRDRFAGS